VSAGAPPINNLPTTLQEQDRLEGPNGIISKYGTVRNYVESVISSGIRGTAMPRWSARLGGPLRDDQIANIAAYLQSWWGEPGGSPNIPPDAAQAATEYSQIVQATAMAQAASDTPVGRGEALFKAQCVSCHNLNDKDSAIPAPGLGGLFSPEGTAAFGTVLPNTKPVNPENFFEWIKLGGVAFKDGPLAEPEAGHGPYQIVAMPGYPQFTDQQLADLLAFLSTLDRSGEQTLPALGPDGQPLPEDQQETAAP
jgi:mono/diheme cytochrome c family protein